MKTCLPRAASTGIAAMLLGGCASTLESSHRSSDFALITSGDVVSCPAGIWGRISVVDVDGTPASEPYGPIKLEPGTHTVTKKCDGSLKTNAVTMAAGRRVLIQQNYFARCKGLCWGLILGAFRGFFLGEKHV